MRTAKPATETVVTADPQTAVQKGLPTTEGNKPQQLTDRIRDYIVSADALQREIEAAQRDAAEAETNADRHVRQYDYLIARGERVKADAILDQIKRLRATAEKLRSRVSEFPPKLEALQREYTQLRSLAHELFLSEEDKLRRAKASNQMAAGIFNACDSSILERARSSLVNWRRELGVEEDVTPAAKSKESSEQTPVQEVKPACPRCRRADRIEPVPGGQPGVFRCTAAFHGPLVFDSMGILHQGNDHRDDRHGESGHSGHGATSDRSVRVGTGY